MASENDITMAQEEVDAEPQVVSMKDEGEEEEEEEDDKNAKVPETFEDLEPFDLYKALKVTSASFNTDRARVAYHRLAYKFHPRKGRDSNPLRFAKVGLAYEILRDEERRRIYDQHGFPGLIASEKFMETSVFELTPNNVYDQFFSEENKEYFFLNGSAMYLSDSENEDQSDDEDENGEDDDDEEAAALAAAAAMEADQAARERFAEKLRQIESKPMPKPTSAAVAASIMAGSTPTLAGPLDIFKEIKRRFETNEGDTDKQMESPKDATANAAVKRAKQAEGNDN